MSLLYVLRGLPRISHHGATAASVRTDGRDAVLSCGVAESPSLLRRPCEAEIEFLYHEAFLLWEYARAKETEPSCVQCRSWIVRETVLKCFDILLANKMPLLYHVKNLCECPMFEQLLILSGPFKGL